MHVTKLGQVCLAHSVPSTETMSSVKESLFSRQPNVKLGEQVSNLLPEDRV
jgi:hypothetical protein